MQVGCRRKTQKKIKNLTIVVYIVPSVVKETVDTVFSATPNITPALVTVIVTSFAIFGFRSLLEATTEDSADGADTGHGAAVTYPLLQKSVSDLPAKNTRIIPLQNFYLFLHFRSSYAGFTSANDSRPDAACFLVSLENLTDASVRDS